MIWGGLPIYVEFSIILSQDGTDHWKFSSLVRTITADSLVMQGAQASGATEIHLVLSKFTGWYCKG